MKKNGYSYHNTHIILSKVQTTRDSCTPQTDLIATIHTNYKKEKNCLMYGIKYGVVIPCPIKNTYK